MNVKLPNGKIIRGIPEGTTKDQIAEKAIMAGIATREDFNMATEQPQPAPKEQQTYEDVPQIRTGADGKVKSVDFPGPFDENVKKSEYFPSIEKDIEYKDDPETKWERRLNELTVHLGGIPAIATTGTAYRVTSKLLGGEAASMPKVAAGTSKAALGAGRTLLSGLSLLNPKTYLIHGARYMTTGGTPIKTMGKGKAQFMRGLKQIKQGLDEGMPHAHELLGEIEIAMSALKKGIPIPKKSYNKIVDLTTAAAKEIGKK